MRRSLIVFSLVVLCPFPSSAQDPNDAPAAQPEPWYSPKKYNPVKLIKHSAKSANDQLASTGDLEAKLTGQWQVQEILPQDKSLQDACSSFRELTECVASLRVSHTLQIEFSCLKWDVTGAKPKPVSDSCAGPSGGKAMGLTRSIDLLKSDTDAKSDRKSTRLNSSHSQISYAVFCLKKKK